MAGEVCNDLRVQQFSQRFVGSLDLILQSKQLRCADNRFLGEAVFAQLPRLLDLGLGRRRLRSRLDLLALWDVSGCRFLVELSSAVNAHHHDHRCGGTFLELHAVSLTPGRRHIDATGAASYNDWLVLNGVVVVFGTSFIVRYLGVSGELIWPRIDLRHAVELLVIWFSIVRRAVVIDYRRPFVR